MVHHNHAVLIYKIWMVFYLISELGNGMADYVAQHGGVKTLLDASEAGAAPLMAAFNDNCKG